MTFPVLFVCICVLNNCHRVATQLQLNIYYVISNHNRNYNKVLEVRKGGGAITFLDFFLIYLKYSRRAGIAQAV